MLYHGDNPILEIVDVFRVGWPGETVNVAPRANSSLTFRIKGSATVTCADSTCHVDENGILYLPQNLGYTAEYSETELIAIHFVTARTDTEPQVFPLQNREAVYEMFRRALQLWENKEPGYGMYAMAQLYTIFGAILEGETRAGMPPYFLKALSYIREHFRDPALKPNAVCAEAGIGTTTFRQLFQKHCHKTPTEYITDLRLTYARNLISGGTPVEIAAYESGFRDSKYFARVVKKHFDCTPRDFKRYGK